jgi:protein-S-isoprenylcysteine O-methyltransferase Ste14
MQLPGKREQIGNWLFRWRSFLPLVTIGLFLLFLRDFTYPNNSHTSDQEWEIFCLLISLLGLGIRIVIAGSIPRGTSGRNTKKQIADQLNTTGMYSIVRHPFYLGNSIIWFGLSLFLRSFWFSFLIMVLFYIYYKTIIFAEERFLETRFGEQFLSWAKNTPMLIPHLRKWKESTLSFSLKAAVKREYSTFFAIIAAFYTLEIISSFFVEKDFAIDTMWTVIFFLSLIFYLTVRAFKKNTRLLEVEGR